MAANVLRRGNYSAFEPDTSNRSERRKKKDKITWKKIQPKISREQQEIDELDEKCRDLTNFSELDQFASFPISQYTLKGLTECGYKKPTDIQKETINLALRSCDILGAAKTGSGKTLAFLVPVLEQLYRKKWSKDDGLGALIVAPVREVAYQIFEILKIVGQYHIFSAGLIIGGQNLSEEKGRMHMCNIVIGTPGRLLQHMDENPLFDPSSLKILVLDEADRILDIGFSKEMNAIFDHLPKERQTLLFSATQTKSVKDLARVSLKDPVYVSVHEHSDTCTPENLQQSYVVCELQDKLDFLWSFLSHHRKKKVLVFVTCCKQVMFIQKAFQRLKIRVRLTGLHGGLNQSRRLAIYEQFCSSEHGVLVATDIAARGLDFPAVDWVVQLDCPEDSKIYIHRAGRTARFDAGGESLLVLMPSEEDIMINYLKAKKITITKIKVDARKQFSLKKKMHTLLAADPELKECAQRVFVTYMKSLFLMKDKKLFDITKLDAEAFSDCLGLVMQPRLRFIQKKKKQQEEEKAKKVAAQSKRGLRAVPLANDESNEEDVSDQDEAKSYPSKINPLYEFEIEKSSDSDDDLLTVKRVMRPEDIPDELPDELNDGMKRIPSKKKPITKPDVAKSILHKKIVPNTRTMFDDDGQVTVLNVPKHQQTEAAKNAELTGEGVPCGLNLKISMDIMKQEYQVDKALFTKRVQAKHKEQRRLARELVREQYADRLNEERQAPVLDTFEDVDLSFLPDPDVIYGPEGGNGPLTINDNDSSCISSTSYDDVGDASDEEDHKIAKRKLEPTKKKSVKRKKVKRGNSSSEEDEENSNWSAIDKKMTLPENEELALRLLTNR